jgi:hypothetical protein
VFVTENELERQLRRVRDGKQQWKDGYKKLIKHAESAQNTKLRSVTDNDGGHGFESKDAAGGRRMGRWARESAIAYWFTGEDKYAERVVEILHHWCLDDKNYMKPTTNVAGEPITIYQHVCFPQLVYAASFLRGHPAWDEYRGHQPWNGEEAGDAESAFRQWVADRYETFDESRPGYCEHNNKWAWRIADRAASAAYLQDDEKMETVKAMWRGDAVQCDNGIRRPWHDFVNTHRNSRAYDETADPTKSALFKKELHRDTAYGYTGFNLKALIHTAVVVKRYDGTDLYSYNSEGDRADGSSLWKAFNWFDEWVGDIDAWENRDFNDQSEVKGVEVRRCPLAFELAYAHWGDFEDAVKDPDRHPGRPHYDNRLLGHVTLTHGVP